MAVLKRFSYDNIVEHNPTAPDPVEGGGSGGGGIMYINSLPPNADGETLTPDKTFAEVQEALLNGILPVFRYVVPLPMGDVIFATLHLYQTGPDSITFSSGAIMSSDATTGEIDLRNDTAKMTAIGCTAGIIRHTLSEGA